MKKRWIMLGAESIDILHAILNQLHEKAGLDATKIIVTSYVNNSGDTAFLIYYLHEDAIDLWK